MPVSRPDNPFHFFLKLPPEVAAPDHYQLLGLPQFTDDRAAIKSAALERNRELRGWDNSDFHIWSNELLDEVVAALIVLESPAAKAEYDRQLREASDRAAPPHHAAPPSRTVANGIRELRRVLAGITPPITATPPTASSNSSDSAVGRGITGTEQTNDRTDEQPFASVGENEVYFEAASNYIPRTLQNPFWRQAPLRNMFAGLLIVVAIAGWWWLMPRYGWVVMLGTDNDLDLFVDGKPITSQHRGQFLHLTAGSHSLVTKSGDETIETHQIDVTSSGPPLVVELKRFRPPVVKSPISAEQAHQLQSAWARHLKVPVQFENSVGMKFQFVPPGEFKMGTDNLGDESPRHTVQLAQPFYFGTHEVTQANYEAVMGNMTNPIIPGEQDHPVTRVSWDNANQFCEKLSNQPDQKSARRIYRLPTEAEWEYACRAGTESAWSFGDVPQQLSEYGWYQSHSNGKTHPFGKLKPNPWGLFDLHGNVSEWCQDWYESSYYRSSPFANPSGPAKQTIFSTRVCRGGSWDSQPNNLRSAFREANSPTIRDSPRVGFRVVLEVDLNSMGILAGPVSEWTTSQSAKSTTTPDAAPKTDYDAIATGKWVRLVDASTPLPDSKKMKFTDGVLELNATILEFKQYKVRDVIVRANVRRASAENVGIMVRYASVEKTYGAWSKNEFAIGKDTDSAPWKDLKSGPASSFGEMAVSVVGDTLTLYVDGKLTHTTRDTDCDRGGIALKAVAGSGFFKDVEIRILDSVENAAAVSPSTTITEQPTQTAIASLPKEVKIVNSIGMTLVRIPAGSFEMGSPATETGRGNDEQQHEVTLTKPYYIGAYEVTQVEYQQVMNTNPSAFKFSDRHPVEQINWPQAVAFCRDLSARAAEKSAGRVYRLPTEAEWEYACRAGTTTPFSDPTRTTQHRRVDRAYLPETVAVGLGQPNRWGLYDMHGLLWEWCADRYGPYTIEPQG